jgi:hypothetical protein
MIWINQLRLSAAQSRAAQSHRYMSVGIAVLNTIFGVNHAAFETSALLGEGVAYRCP